MTQTNGIPGDPKPHIIVAEKNGVLAANETAIAPAVPAWTVEGALAEFGLPTHTTPPTSPITFFHLIERLKTTPREGWRRFGLDGLHRGESISDHMYRMSIMTMTAPASLSSRLDIARCTRMALVHDMAEALVGDITPADPVSKEDKSRREADTIDYIADRLLGSVPNGGREAGQAMREVWREYEDSVTEESKFVHDVDKLELLLQMVEYEKAAKTTKSEDLGEFTGAAARIVLPEMRQWAAEVLKERVDFWKAKGDKIPCMFKENQAYIAANLRNDRVV